MCRQCLPEHTKVPMCRCNSCIWTGPRQLQFYQKRIEKFPHTHWYGLIKTDEGLPVGQVRGCVKVRVGGGGLWN